MVAGVITYGIGVPVSLKHLLGRDTTRLPRKTSMAAPVVPPPDNNLIAWFVAGGGAVGTAVIAFWQWFKNNKLGQAGVNAQLDVINMLKEQLDAERVRADAATASRDNALDQIRGMKDQIAALTAQVQRLETVIKMTNPTSATTASPPS